MRAPRARASADGSRATRRRLDQRAQVLPIVALSAALLLGASALALDLSLQTHYRRALQNVTDSAALAGARDLTWGAADAGPGCALQQQAVLDALKVIRTTMGWPAGWAESALAPTAPPCSGWSVSATYQAFNVTVHTPPVASVTHNGDVGAVEVLVRESNSGGVGAAIGLGGSQEAGHSVAVHTPSGLPFGYGLYAQIIEGGNNGEVVDGSMYAGRYANPQSSSGGNANQSYICTERGSVFLGYPQFVDGDTTAGDDQYMQSPNGNAPDVVQRAGGTPSDCQNAVGAYVNQTTSLASSQVCPQFVNGNQVPVLSHQDAVGGAGSLACVFQPALSPPDLQEPTISAAYVKEPAASGNNQSSMTITTPPGTGPGVYDISHNPGCSPSNCFDVVINGNALSPPTGCEGTPYAGFYQLCLLGYTFILEPGATMGLTKGAGVLLTPYVPPSGVPPNPSDGHIPIYSPCASEACAPVDNGGGLWLLDNGTSLATSGTVYLPNGTVSSTSQAHIAIQGQAIVYRWAVQSGNAQQPVITYNGANLAPQREVLRLAE